MTEQTLAQLSNTAIYSAVVVLTLAMLAYAVYLARLVPARDAAAEATVAQARELVAAGAGDGATTAPTAPMGGAATAATASGPTERTMEPVGARKAAGIGWMLTVLGTVFVIAGVVLRAAEVHR